MILYQYFCTIVTCTDCLDILQEPFISKNLSSIYLCILTGKIHRTTYYCVKQFDWYCITWLLEFHQICNGFILSNIIFWKKYKKIDLMVKFMTTSNSVWKDCSSIEAKLFCGILPIKVAHWFSGSLNKISRKIDII